MRFIKSVGIYAVANASIAFVGLVLTLALGRLLGASHYGELASFIAFQNIWAALGFIRIETRISTCKTDHEAFKIILAGFLTGACISAGLSLTALTVLGAENNFYMVFPAGFALAIFDAITIRHAYMGHQRSVVVIRALRTAGPILIALVLAFFLPEIDDVIRWQTWITVGVALLVWRMWIHPLRWIKITLAIVKKYRHGLIPSLLFCLLNGVFLNGLTPLLSAISTPSLAGQFAMLQRLLGGGLGVISAAVSTYFSGRDFVNVKWLAVRKILFANLGASTFLCALMAVPILFGADLVLGTQWNFSFDLYLSMSVYLIASYCVGSISMLASRLKDEWFLTAWQSGAILIWMGTFFMLQPEVAINWAQLSGAMMYALLVVRWYFLLKKRHESLIS